MNQRKITQSEIHQLYKRIEELEKIEINHQHSEAQLKAANQQLDAANQQLRASEEQLKASEQQLIAINKQLQHSEQAMKARELEAQSAREFAENILDTTRQPLLVLDSSLKVISVNRHFCLAFQVTEKETVGRLLFNLGNNQWDIPELRKLINNILPKKSTVEDYEVSQNFENIGQKIMLLNARELRQ